MLVTPLERFWPESHWEPCNKALGVLQVKSLENAAFTIGSVMLFLWRWPNVSWGESNNSLKQPSWEPSGVWFENLLILRPLPQILKLKGYLIRSIFLEKVCRKPAVKTSSMRLFNLVNSPKQPTHVWDF